MNYELNLYFDSLVTEEGGFIKGKMSISEDSMVDITSEDGEVLYLRIDVDTLLGLSDAIKGFSERVKKEKLENELRRR